MSIANASNGLTEPDYFIGKKPERAYQESLNRGCLQEALKNRELQQQRDYLPASAINSQPPREVWAIYDFMRKTHTTSGKVRECDIMDELAQKTLDNIHAEHTYHEIKDVIDIGCGVGRDMDLMRNTHGKNVTGVTISSDDAFKLRQRGYKVLVCDQNLIPAKEHGQYDMVWSRHCLEHSIMPFFTLHKYHQLLRDNGVCYLEVPAAELKAKQETNPNHYSVLGPTMLKELIARIGFQIVSSWSYELDYTMQDGSEIKAFDKWDAYFLRKVPLVNVTL